jgi:hypothetical protein
MFWCVLSGFGYRSLGCEKKLCFVQLRLLVFILCCCLCLYLCSCYGISENFLSSEFVYLEQKLRGRSQKIFFLNLIFRPATCVRLLKDWWWLLSPRAGHRNCPKIFKIVETYWHDHSLENSWGALSDGTIRFSIQPFSGGNAFSESF